MGYAHLFTDSDMDLLRAWLEESGELYIDLDRPHSGGSNSSFYFLRDLAGLRAIVAAETWPEVSISIFRAKQYPIRGVAGAALLQETMQHIPDGEWFSILAPCVDPLTPGGKLGSGDSHVELRNEFTRLQNQPVWVGQDPFDVPPMGHESRFMNSPEHVFVVRFYQNPPRVLKNR